MSRELIFNTAKKAADSIAWIFYLGAVLLAVFKIAGIGNIELSYWGIFGLALIPDLIFVAWFLALSALAAVANAYFAKQNKN